MKEYFYTNEALGNLLPRKESGTVDWEKAGFSVREVSRAVSAGYQHGTGDGETLSLLPVADKTAFLRELGAFVTLGQEEDIFYRLVSEEEAAQLHAVWQGAPAQN